MAVKKRAGTVCITVDVAGESYTLFNVPDPRWRINEKAKYGGVDAMHGDQATPLSLAALKFIGGLFDEGESAVVATLRELGEEAGKKLAARVEAAGLEPVYVMRRPLEWSPKDDVELTYLHAHIKVGSLEELRSLIQPDDDCFAIAIAKTEQVVKTEVGYAIVGDIPAENIIFRESYTPIPYQDWARETGKPIPEPALRAFEHYNTVGPTNPLVGIDVESLKGLSVALYTPKGTSPTAVMSDEQIRSGMGGAVPDGAIYMDMIKPRAQGSMSRRDDAAIVDGPNLDGTLPKAG